MTEPDESSAPDASRLHGPLARILRPLVRLLIRSGVTFPAVCDLLREIYVNVAEFDLALPGRSQTDSRVSLITGIHRKEVARLRGAGAPVSAVPAALSRTSRIMARWLSAPDYTDASGKPLPLPRAGARSFEELVASVTRDLRPRAVLDDWLDRKLVTTNGDDQVVLAETAFIPVGGSDQQLYYFGRNLHDHVAAAVANVLGPQPRHFERAVHYDGLSAALASTLEARAKELATEALTQANRDANHACEADDGGRWRWNFGVYIFREEAPPTSDGIKTEGAN